MVKVMQLKEGGDETKCEKTITVEKKKCKNKGRCPPCILCLSISLSLRNVIIQSIS